ncbi:MAG: flagellar assembly peptidoglycan hydrolase FlgJ [Gallionellaceae bacterium]|nr:MAG: flagellar assembly peptidoglycan hydrolase FlgJ [Gallionellaceae bacterium]
MGISANDIGSLAVDTQNLDKLRLQAKQSPDQALKGAAQQFEQVFLNMMLKSMREATPQEGMFDNEQTKMFTGMLDQQLAQSMSSGHGIGLADVMVRQLGHASPTAGAAANTGAAPATGSVAKNAVPSAYNENFQQDFVKKLMPHAEQASRETGISAHSMVGQAALESGWGRREIKMADSTNSYNLFGIKAGANWKGKVAEVTTTEYHNGVAHKQVEKFRAYASYAEAFKDYANTLSSNPRYSEVLRQGDSAQGFAHALQQAGYATDPHYGDKLSKVINSVNTLA